MPVIERVVIAVLIVKYLTIGAAFVVLRRHAR